MKTIYINCSPKRHLSVSSYLLGLIRLFVKGEAIKETLRTPKDYNRVLESLKGADAVVFGIPLYVDGIPSHTLSFMKKMEVYCKENNLSLRVYTLSNGGFIEGSQSEPLMQLMENFCKRSDLKWCGGIGFGGGVMLNVLRILIPIWAAICIMNILQSGIQSGNWLPASALFSFLSDLLTFCFFQLGLLFYGIRMSYAISKGTTCGKKYTRILLPAVVFILIADVFFSIISVFQGGMFRGWLSRKK